MLGAADSIVSTAWLTGVVNVAAKMFVPSMTMSSWHLSIRPALLRCMWEVREPSPKSTAQPMVDLSITSVSTKHWAVQHKPSFCSRGMHPLGMR